MKQYLVSSDLVRHSPIDTQPFSSELQWLGRVLEELLLRRGGNCLPVVKLHGGTNRLSFMYLTPEPLRRWAIWHIEPTDIAREPADIVQQMLDGEEAGARAWLAMNPEHEPAPQPRRHH